MKIPIYLAVAATLLIGVAACQPNLPAGTVVAVPQPAPAPPPPPPVQYVAPMPVPQAAQRYDYYVKGPRGNWAQKRCPVGQHWQHSHRIMVKVEGAPSKSKVVPGHCR